MNVTNGTEHRRTLDSLMTFVLYLLTYLLIHLFSVAHFRENQ